MTQTTQHNANMSNGTALNPSNHRQPHVSIMNSASTASNAAPIAQNDSINTTHFARWADGRNSAYNVTLHRIDICQQLKQTKRQLTIVERRRFRIRLMHEETVTNRRLAKMRWECRMRMLPMRRERDPQIKRYSETSFINRFRHFSKG